MSNTWHTNYTNYYTFNQLFIDDFLPKFTGHQTLGMRQKNRFNTCLLYYLMERSPGGQNLKPNKLAICEIIITSVPKEIAFLKLFF